MRRRENDMLWNTQHERNRANHIISSGLSHSFLHLFVLLALKPPCKRMRHCWILHVASICTPCYILLSFVGNCWAKFENGQIFDPATPNISFVPWSPMRSATMLDLFAQVFPTLLGPCSQTRQLHMVSNRSSPRCTTVPKFGSCSVCTRLHTRKEATTPCYVRLHITLVAFKSFSGRYSWSLQIRRRKVSREAKKWTWKEFFSC